MEPDFRALQVIAEVSLGIVGFSAILIGLSRSKDGFSSPDTFRIQLLTFSAFGAMFCSLMPFAIFNGTDISTGWKIVSLILCTYSLLGLNIFPRKVLMLRSEGFKDLFPIKLVLLQIGILISIFFLAGAILFGFFEQKNTVYLSCLLLFVLQSTIAFIRTMFYRVN
tara:strand:- start:16 stop:513 length:498 start_codon:yes stop_codon:yes gene_type:complete